MKFVEQEPPANKPPRVRKARRTDLYTKEVCWRGHIDVAKRNGDLAQIRIGMARLKEVEDQAGGNHSNARLDVGKAIA